MSEKKEIAYGVYFNDDNIACLTCEANEGKRVDGWGGHKLCSVPVDGEDDHDSQS
jgi:hypothetical protein